MVRVHISVNMCVCVCACVLLCERESQGALWMASDLAGGAKASYFSTHSDTSLHVTEGVLHVALIGFVHELKY